MPKTASPKPKKVSYELIDRSSVPGHPMYALLDELVWAHHKELSKARIALAWCTSWNPDADGRVKLGQCKKASDLDRDLHQFDFIILLRKSFWTDDRVTPQQRRALLDHELMHATVKIGKHGESVEDERGRLVYRTRRHDLEEFTDIVRRYGLYKADLEQFAAALRQHLPTFEGCQACEGSPGWVAVKTDDGVPTVQRCACWTEHTTRVAELSA